MSEQKRRKISLWIAGGLLVIAAVALSVTAQQGSWALKTSSKDEIHGYIFTNTSSGQKFLPDVTVYAKNTDTSIESDRVKTDCRGLFIIPPQPDGDYEICWSKAGYTSGCSADPVTLAGRTAYPLPYQILPASGMAMAGAVSLAGGTAANYVDVAFGIEETASVSLLDANTFEVVRQQDVGCNEGYAFAGVTPGDYLLRADYAGQQVTAEARDEVVDLTFPNRAPSIQAIWAGNGSTGLLRAAPGSTVLVNVEASDPDNDPLIYDVRTNDGQIFETQDPAIIGWTLGFDAPAPQMQVLVSDEKGGFDRRVFSISPESELRFSGQVLGEDDQPLVGALVRVNGIEVLTGENGWFQIEQYEDSPRHVLTIQSSGYMLFSRTYQTPRENRIYRLTRALTFPINPRQPSEVTAVSGRRTASVRFGPGTLVGPEGQVANGPLNVSIGIVDPADPDGGMPGDYLATNGQEQEVALSSFGAISVSIEDASGNEFNLRPGTSAQVSIPIPENRLEGGELPPTVPLWIYNETSGFWEEVGQAVLKGQSYVGAVPHFSEINADVEFTNPVCMRILVDSSLQSFLPFDVRIEVIPTGDVLVKEIDSAINSLYALPASSNIEFVVLDSSGTPIESTRQTVSTGVYDAACSSAPTYPYTCCTSTATLSIAAPAGGTFLDYFTVGLSDVYEALWYTSVIDPVAATDTGTVTTGGTTVTGAGTGFSTFFVPGDLIRPQPVSGAGTVTNSASSTTVNGTGTTFTSLFNVGDIIEAAGQTRLVMAITSDTELTTNSAFDPPLTGAAYDRAEVRLVELVSSATSLDINTAFNHTYTGVTYEKVGTKPTLADWETANNMGTPDAEAAYYNGGDLGFGRYMKMKVTGSDVAYAVANYGTPGTFDPSQVAFAVLAATGGTDLRFATVAMEHSPNDLLGGIEYTKFYVYGGSGARILKADLDGVGDKFIPRLCVICHGGNMASADSRGDIEAEFLPFDLPTFEPYSLQPGFTRADQEADFKLLNRRINDLTTPPPALDEMIKGSYGGLGYPLLTFDDTYVPGPWNNNVTERELYNFVVKKSCRGCHVTRDGIIDWSSYADFDAYSGFIETLICSSKTMPNALLTYENMWLSTSPHQPNVLASSGLTFWTGTVPCP